MTLVLHQPLVLEPYQRRADERAAHAEGVGQIAFDQPLVGLEAAGDDGFTEAILGTEWRDPEVVDHLVHWRRNLPRGLSRAQACGVRTRRLGAPRQLVPPAGAPHTLRLRSHTVRRIAYNLSNNYDGDRLSEEHVEIEEEI